MKKHEHITILGGGIAGLTTAIALKKTGFETTVFEAANEIKPLGAGLGLGTNALMAFDQIGLKERVTGRGRMLASFTILNQQGKVIQKPFQANGQHQPADGTFAIHRADLHAILLSEIAPASLIPCKRLVDLRTEPTGIRLLFADGSIHTTDYLIVADGIHSPARQKLIPGSVPRYAGYSCWRGVVDQPAVLIETASETWGKNGRVGMVPLPDNRVYWYACINGRQNDPAMRKFRTEDLYRVFEAYHAPIPQLIQQTRDESLLWNDIIDLKPLNQFAYGRCVLIGDAAHATTPNMGQGACQAIEDAVVLAQCMGREPDFERAFRQFEQRRLGRTRWITATSWKLGRIAQIDNPFLIALRDAAIRLMPDSMSEKQMRTIGQVDF